MIGLDSNWKFKNIQDNIEAVKTQYEDILSSFSYFEMKKRGNVLHKMRQEVFKFDNIEYWQRERLWEVLNGDFEIEKFRRLCRKWKN